MVVDDTREWARNEYSDSSSPRQYGFVRTRGWHRARNEYSDRHLRDESTVWRRPRRSPPRNEYSDSSSPRLSDARCSVRAGSSKRILGFVISETCSTRPPSYPLISLETNTRIRHLRNYRRTDALRRTALTSKRILGFVTSETIVGHWIYLMAMSRIVQRGHHHCGPVDDRWPTRTRQCPPRPRHRRTRTGPARRSPSAESSAPGARSPVRQSFSTPATLSGPAAHARPAQPTSGSPPSDERHHQDEEQAVRLPAPSQCPARRLSIRFRQRY